MKTQISKSKVKKMYDNIFHIEGMRYLEYYFSPFAYSTRSEGWACDYYDLDNFCVCKGYDPIGQDVDRKALKVCEAKADKVFNSEFFTYETKKRKILALYMEFLKSSINK